MTGMGVAAWVGGEVISRADVADELDRLRAGPLGARLPAGGTAEARQLRRWVTQRLVLRHLLESAARGPAGTAGPPAPPEAEAVPSVPTDPTVPVRRGVPSAPDPALLGSAAADVLATSGAARAVFVAVTAAIRVPEADIRRFYAANPDRFARPARWVLRHACHPADPTGLAERLPGAAPVTASPDTLPAAVRTAIRAAGPPPVTVGPVCTPLGWHLVAVDAEQPPTVLPYPDVHDQIAAQLLDRARQRAFARWLDARYAALVRLAPGYEHPADPRQPDATHRH
jgi:[acyl-carrier-protein] S-malonyltransferase